MGEFQNGGYKKTKHANFSKKLTFLTLRYTHVRETRFREIWLVFCFCNNHFEICLFALLPTIYHGLLSRSFITVSLKFILHLKSEIPRWGTSSSSSLTTSQNRWKGERLIKGGKKYARNYFLKKILSKNSNDSVKKDSEFWVQKFGIIFLMNIWYEEDEQELL